MEKSKKFYSVWALFDYKHQKEIEKIRNKVNNFILGPSFNIHLTLSCCLFGKRKEIIDQMKEIKSYLEPFYIELNNYGYKNKFFQSFYIKVKKNNELIIQKRIIDKLFKLKNNYYFPHVSLFYGDAKKAIKDEIINNLPIFKQIIKINKVCIVLNDEKNLKWEVIKVFKILGNKD